MDCADLARKADVARAAMIDLAAVAAKVPKLRLNLLRSIELLEELAIRARGGETELDSFASGDQLSSALPGGLRVPAGVLPELKAAVTPEALVAHEIAVRSDLARRNGAKGGGQRTPAQVASSQKTFGAARVRAAAKKQALAEGQSSKTPGAK
jgi:hypothetical protein